MIEDTARFLTGRGMSVFFDAEHFFDGYLEDAAYALSTLEAASRGGAARLVLCDTNGGTLPGEIAAAVREAGGRCRRAASRCCATPRASSASLPT